MDKIKNWFNGIGSTVAGWVSTNLEKITTGMLLAATMTFVGLTIYFIYDYKNYQKLLSKIAELNKINLMERANVALEPENINIEEKLNEIKAEVQEQNTKMEYTEETERPKIELGRRGRRYK